MKMGLLFPTNFIISGINNYNFKIVEECFVLAFMLVASGSVDFFSSNLTEDEIDTLTILTVFSTKRFSIHE